jgi:hypothetical protein
VKWKTKCGWRSSQARALFCELHSSEGRMFRPFNLRLAPWLVTSQTQHAWTCSWPVKNSNTSRLIVVRPTERRSKSRLARDASACWRFFFYTRSATNSPDPTSKVAARAQ